MILDWDDFTSTNHRLDLLHQLKAVRPDFRCTVFAIPTGGTDSFWESVPDWVELAMHGWEHGDPPTDGGECKDWSRDKMAELMEWVHPRLAGGFKAPGWQISDGCYQALLSAGWWVADQHYNDHRRPAGLETHCLGDGDHWHGHIQDVCGNGLEETFAEVMRRVREAPSFEFMSEVVQ